MDNMNKEQLIELTSYLLAMLNAICLAEDAHTMNEIAENGLSHPLLYARNHIKTAPMIG